MSPTFYRKYRPTRFAEVIGQTEIVKTIENSLKSDQVAHAYLLTGPRGTGKTTLARLFAQAVNCVKRKGTEPCGDCLPCTLQREGRSLDIIEIDAASHTGVDNIRELKETVAFPPTAGKRKVYIIDEAHMLSLGAWNALLKTLEEPPTHVMFILATTRADKVPETILSRAVRFDLAPFPIESLTKKLAHIAKAEKIKIDKEALVLIARAARGGMRDAEVLFTRIAALEESPIEASRVALLLGATSTTALHRLLSFVAEHDLAGSLTYLRELKMTGTSLSQLTLSLLEYLRQALFFSIDAESAHRLVTDMTREEKLELAALAERFGSERLVAALEHLQEAVVQMKDTLIPELPLEIALAKLIRPTPATPPSSVPPTPPSHDPGSSSGLDAPQKKPSSSPTAPGVKEAVTAKVPEKTIASTETAAEAIDLSQIIERWEQVVACAKKLNASLGVALSSATPSAVRNNRLALSVKYPFHRDRLETKAHRLTLGKAFDTILGFQVAWTVEVNPSLKAEADATTPIIDQALDILGGQLVPENN